VDAVVEGMKSPQTRQQIDQAADLIAARIKAGEKVGVATITHFLLSEIEQRPRLKVEPFHAVWRAAQAFEGNLRPGDMCVWISEVGLSTGRINMNFSSQDYATPLRGSGATLITSYVTDARNPGNNQPDAAAHIEQHWKPYLSPLSMAGAVKVGFPPGAIAPVSGIDQGLIYRVLEDAVLARLRQNSSKSHD
jgi:hypothetical protein